MKPFKPLPKQRAKGKGVAGGGLLVPSLPSPRSLEEVLALADEQHSYEDDFEEVVTRGGGYQERGVSSNSVDEAHGQQGHDSTHTAGDAGGWHVSDNETRSHTMAATTTVMAEADADADADAEEARRRLSLAVKLFPQAASHAGGSLIDAEGFRALLSSAGLLWPGGPSRVDAAEGEGGRGKGKGMGRRRGKEEGRGRERGAGAREAMFLVSERQATHVYRKIKESSQFAGPGFSGIDCSQMKLCLSALSKCIPAMEWGKARLPEELEDAAGKGTRRLAELDMLVTRGYDLQAEWLHAGQQVRDRAAFALDRFEHHCTSAVGASPDQHNLVDLPAFMRMLGSVGLLGGGFGVPWRVEEWAVLDVAEATQIFEEQGRDGLRKAECRKAMSGVVSKIESRLATHPRNQRWGTRLGNDCMAEESLVARRARLLSDMSGVSSSSKQQQQDHPYKQGAGPPTPFVPPVTRRKPAPMAAPGRGGGGGGGGGGLMRYRQRLPRVKAGGGGGVGGGGKDRAAVPWLDTSAAVAYKTFELISLEKEMSVGKESQAMMLDDGPKQKEVVWGKQVSMSAREAFEYRRRNIAMSSGHHTTRVPITGTRPKTRPGKSKVMRLRMDKEEMEERGSAMMSEFIHSSIDMLETLVPPRSSRNKTQRDAVRRTTSNDGSVTSDRGGGNARQGDKNRGGQDGGKGRKVLIQGGGVKKLHVVRPKVKVKKTLMYLKERMAQIFATVYEAFVYFDALGTCILTKTDLKRNLMKLKMVPRDVEPGEFAGNLLHEVDSRTVDGQVDFQEFCQFFSWHPLGDADEEYVHTKKHRREIVTRATKKVQAMQSDDPLMEPRLRDMFATPPETFPELRAAIDELYTNKRLFTKYCAYGSGGNLLSAIGSRALTMDVKELVMLLQHTKLLSNQGVGVPKSLLLKVFASVTGEVDKKREKEREEDPDKAVDAENGVKTTELTWDLFKAVLCKLTHKLGLGYMDDEDSPDSKNALMKKRRKLTERLAEVEGMAKSKMQLRGAEAEPGVKTDVMLDMMNTEQREEWHRLRRLLASIGRKIAEAVEREREEAEAAANPRVDEKTAKMERLVRNMQRRLDSDMLTRATGETKVGQTGGVGAGDSEDEDEDEGSRGGLKGAGDEEEDDNYEGPPI